MWVKVLLGRNRLNLPFTKCSNNIRYFSILGIYVFTLCLLLFYLFYVSCTCARNQRIGSTSVAYIMDVLAEIKHPEGIFLSRSGSSAVLLGQKASQISVCRRAI